MPVGRFLTTPIRCFLDSGRRGSTSIPLPGVDAPAAAEIASACSSSALFCCFLASLACRAASYSRSRCRSASWKLRRDARPDRP